MSILGELVVLIAGNNALLTSSLAKSEAELTAFSGAATHHSGLASTALHAAGLAAVGLGAAAAVGTAVAVNAAADFQDQMAIINTIARQTPQELEKTGQSIRGLAASTGEPLKTLTQGFYDLLSAGIAPANAMAVLTQSTTLAIGALATTDQTVDLLTTAINSYGLTVSQSARATDMFALAVQDGKVTAAQIASSFADIAPLAKQAGIGIDEISASYATLTARGVPAAEVPTQMNRAIIELLKPNADLNALMEKTHLNFAEIAKQKGLVVALEEMRKAAEANHVPFTDLFGRLEGLKFALATTGGNFDAYGTELTKMHTVTGTASAQAEERMGTFNRQAAILGETFGSLLVTIGGPLLPAFTGLVQALNDGVSAIAAWVSGFPNIGAALASLVPGEARAALEGMAEAARDIGTAFTTAFAGIASALGGIAGGALEGLRSAIAWLSDHRDVIPLVAGAIAGPLVLAFGAWAVSAGAAAVATIAALAPILAIGAAIGVLAAAWITDFAGIRTTVTNVVATVAPIIQGVLGGAINFVGHAISVVVGWVTSFVTHLTGTTNASAGTSSALSTIGAVLTTIGNVILTVVTRVATFIGGLVDGANKMGIFKAIGDGITLGFGLLGDAIRITVQFVSLLATGISGTLQSAFLGIQSIIGAVTGAINAAIEAIKGLIKGAQEAVAAVAAIPGVKLVGDVAGNAAGAVGNAANAVGDILGLADGGLVPGPIGAAVPAIVHGGEAVFTPSQLSALGTGGGGGGGGATVHTSRTIQVVLDRRVIAEMLDEELLRLASGYSSGLIAAPGITGA